MLENVGVFRELGLIFGIKKVSVFIKIECLNLEK